MKNTWRFIVAGVALGAIAGALVALWYQRAGAGATAAERQEGQPAELSLSQLARLGLLVLGAIKQILALT